MGTILKTLPVEGKSILTLTRVGVSTKFDTEPEVTGQYGQSSFGFDHSQGLLQMGYVTAP